MADEEKLPRHKISTDTVHETLKTHTKYAHIVRGRPILKYVERFRNGSVREPFIEKHAISTKLSNINQEKHRRKSHRVCGPDRKPSRIPIRSLKRLRIKSRKVRKFFYARVLLWIPVSFTLYCYVNTKKLLNKKTFKLNCRERILQCIWKVKYRASRWLKLVCSCKNEARVANYCNYKLSRDRKKIVALQHMLTLTKQ